MDKELRQCLMNMAQKLCAEWKDLGRYLGISEDELLRIREEYEGDSIEMNYQMLLSLHRKNNFISTPEKLTVALTDIGGPNLAGNFADIISTIDRKGKEWTPDNQLGDPVMADIFTYSKFKETLASSLQTDDCMRLTSFFRMPKDQTEAILSSDTPPGNFLLAMEEKGVLQPHNVEKLTEAFVELKMNMFCRHVVEIYQKTRAQSTLYGRFLATLSAHLTGSLPAELCVHFNIHEELKSSITLSQNPGLSLLLALDKMGVIKPSEVEALVQPFTELRLVQAVAKINEYQSILGEEIQFLKRVDVTMEDKVDVFITCLQKKIKSWYETMTPVPWKKSCRWMASDLFVGLILTDSKVKTNTSNLDQKCKLQYQDVLTHDSLKSESRLILEGDPGSGKTMLTSQLAYDWAQGKLKDTRILILLPLKLVDGITLEVAIKRFYVTESTPLTEKDIVSILESGKLSTVILLDGLEEYSSPMTKAEGKPSEVHEIMSKGKYPDCKVVLTSRSDCVHDLPECKMLRLGKFSETERNTYIEKVFADDEGKQREIKRIVEDTPLILDLCSVPLLFVLSVHNIESVERLQKDQLNRVTPFMGGMVDTLSPTFYKDRTHPLKLDEYEHKDASIEKLAFNGLCKGFQQLSWSKDFMDENIDNVKKLIDSGVLVVEEGITIVTEYEERVDKQVMKGTMEIMHSEMDNVPTTSGFLPVKKSTTSKVEVGSSSLSEQVQRGPSESKRKSKQSSSGSTASNVPLQLKFLHKLFQEWFAAKYLSSVIWFENKESFSDQLALIDPIDLHYVLRFTCYLCPPSCHIVLNHLLNSYRSREDIIPKHIMDCICLCYTEYDGDMGDDIKLVVSEICKETITIQSIDSRLLQQSKIAMLKFASQSEIPITKVQLLDVVTSVSNKRLTFNSGLPMDKLDTLQEIEVIGWDPKLEDEDYKHLLNFIASSKCVKIVSLNFPNQPPQPHPSTLEEISSKHIAVDWHIGQVKHTWNISQKKWTIHLKEDQTTKISALEVDPDFITEDFKGVSTPVSLPGTSRESTSLKQAQLKRPVQELGCAGAIPKKRTKVGLSRKDKSLLEEKQGEILDGASLHAEAFIDKDGGTLFLCDADISLHVPAGALTHGCIIRITVPLNSKVSSSYPEVLPRLTPLTICEPDDLHFQLPVKLTLPHCAVIKNPNNHTVTVKLGKKSNVANEMTWVSEAPKYSLSEHYCSVFLKHFTHVGACITSTKEKILRVIPYTKLVHENVQVLTVWLCNDLESDFQSVIQSEEKNEGLPLDSYDTFRCVSELGNEVKVSLEALEGSNWHLDENENEVKTIPVKELLNINKIKRNFWLVSDGNDDESYMYFLLRVIQTVRDEKTETTFALRKRICDLKMPATFRKPVSRNKQASHMFPTESLRTYTAVVYMDPVKRVNDDVIVTVWLSPFDSSTEMFQGLQNEQELQYRHQVDTENSFLIVNDKPAVVTKTQFLNGQWLLFPTEMKIETERIRCGSRAKFQFIGKTDKTNKSEHIKLQVETFQVGEGSIRFITYVKLNQLLYEIRQRHIEKLKASANEDPSNPSNEGAKSYESKTNLVPDSSLTVINRKLEEQGEVNQASQQNSAQRNNEQRGKTVERHTIQWLSEKVGMEWKAVCRNLLEDSELELLQANDMNNVQEVICQCILKWKKRNGSDATVGILSDALRKGNRTDLAQEIFKQ